MENGYLHYPWKEDFNIFRDCLHATRDNDSFTFRSGDKSKQQLIQGIVQLSEGSKGRKLNISSTAHLLKHKLAGAFL